MGRALDAIVHALQHAGEHVVDVALRRVREADDGCQPGLECQPAPVLPVQSGLGHGGREPQRLELGIEPIDLYQRCVAASILNKIDISSERGLALPSSESRQGLGVHAADRRDASLLQAR